MKAILLAAGRSRRLGHITDDIPKTMLPVRGETTILDVILRNLSHVDVRDVVIVTGWQAQLINDRVPGMADRYGLRIETIYNDWHLDSNNCYSLWLARAALVDSAFVINADTIHPASVEETLLASRGPDILLALDDVKKLGEEEMKVLMDGDGRVVEIRKTIDPMEASGEHIGVSLVEGSAAARVTECLEVTWRRDANRWFEDGYEEFIARGGRIGCAGIGDVRWIEVDFAEDYDRGKEIASEY